MIDFVFYLVVGLIISLIWNYMYVVDSNYITVLLSISFCIPAFGVVFGILMLLITPCLILNIKFLQLRNTKLNQWLFNDDMWKHDNYWFEKKK